MFNPNDIIYSRRLFLNRGVQLLSLAGTLPLFLDRGAHCLAADFAANPSGAGRPDDHVLVVLQLVGGNDGLNTVIPPTATMTDLQSSPHARREKIRRVATDRRLRSSPVMPGFFWRSL